MRITESHQDRVNCSCSSIPQTRVLVVSDTPIVKSFLLNLIRLQFSETVIVSDDISQIKVLETDCLLVEGDAATERSLERLENPNPKIVALDLRNDNIRDLAYKRSCIVLDKPQPEQLAAALQCLVNGDAAEIQTITAETPLDDVSRPCGAQAQFTDRETQVFQWMIKGYRNKQIAAELGIQVSTVRGYVTAIFDKTGIRSRHRLVTQLGAMELASV